MSTLGDLISSHCLIIEYAQKGAPENPPQDKYELLIEAHLADLKEIVMTYNTSDLILIGHSWGASLALLFLAQNPGIVSKTILIGAAPLDEEASKKFSVNLQQRFDPETKSKIQLLNDAFEKAESPEEKNILMQNRLKLIGPFYHLDPKTEERLSHLKWDYTSFVSSIDSLWDLIDAGKIPELLKKISDPVVAFHGEADPIPRDEVLNFLSCHLSQFKKKIVKKTGHFPWLEKEAQAEFVNLLLEELKS